MRRSSIGRAHTSFGLYSLILSAFAIALQCAPAFAQDDDGDGFSVARVGSLLLSNGIAFDEDSGRAFVTSSYGGVTVIDVSGNRYLQTFDISRQVTAPNSVAYAAGKLYVGTLRDIAVVDASDGRVLRWIVRPFYAGTVESEMTASPDGTRVYAVAGSSPAMMVIDVATDSEEALIQVGPDCNRIALSPDGSVAYVTNKERGLLFAVDIRTRSVLESVEIAPGKRVLDFPCGVGVASTTGKIYVSWVGTDYRSRVSVFNSGLTHVDTIETGRFTTGLDVSDDGQFALLGSGQVIDLETGLFAASLSLPQNGICDVTFLPGSELAIVTHGSERAVNVVTGFEPPLRARGTPRLGGRLDLTLNCPAGANTAYQIVASNTTSNGFLACDGILFPLDLDPLFQLTRAAAGSFRSWTGTLDSRGRASASLVLSNDLPIRGAGYPISLAFATFLDSRDRDGVNLVSNTVTAWVRP